VSLDRFHRPPLAAIWDPVRVVHTDHECFADEITVDFPPVAPLVERERDVFLGAAIEPDALKTEVSLSVRDATRGTVVPLEVPLRGTCARCGGRGETWPEPCASCSGTGDRPIQRRVLLSVPPGVSDGTRFRFRVRAPHAPSVRVEVRVAVGRPAA
jgi:hypothetical protein